KQLGEIEELLNSVPIEPTPEEIQAMVLQDQAQQAEFAQATQVASATGLPVPPAPKPFDPASAVCDPTDVNKIGTMSAPSIPIHPWDFDPYEAQSCLDWLNSDACKHELKVGRVLAGAPKGTQPQPNIRGVQNVYLHYQEHVKAAAAKQPPV